MRFLLAAFLLMVVLLQPRLIPVVGRASRPAAPMGQQRGL
jgi:hypothetical protein